MRRGAPGTGVSQSAAGRPSTRAIVARLFVLQAERIVDPRSGGGSKLILPGLMMAPGGAGGNRLESIAHAATEL